MRISPRTLPKAVDLTCLVLSRLKSEHVNDCRHQCETLQRQWAKQIVIILEDLLNVPFQTFKSAQCNSTNVHWEGIKKDIRGVSLWANLSNLLTKFFWIISPRFPIFKSFNYMFPVSFLLILSSLPLITVLIWASLLKYVGPSSRTWLWKFISSFHMVDLICHAIKDPMGLTGVCPLTTR